MKAHRPKVHLLLALTLAAVAVFPALAETRLPHKPLGDATDAAKSPRQADSIAPGSSELSRGPRSAGSEKAPGFEQMDKNHDDYIDSTEAAAIPGLVGEFDAADRDKDGRLDRAEFEQAVRQLQQKNQRRAP